MLTLYKIYKEGDNNFYIGSTKDMYLRAISHKSCCKKNSQKVYEYIRANGGWNNWKMEKIGECGSVSGEIKYIKEKKPSLNTYTYHRNYNHSQYNIKYKKKNKEHYKQVRKYQSSWGGDLQYWNNNLLNINPLYL